MDMSRIAYAIWPWGTAEREQMERASKEITEIGFTSFESVKKAIYAYDMNVKAYKEVLDRFNLKPISFYFHLLRREVEKEVFSNLEKELEFVAELGVKRVCLQGTGGRPDRQNPNEMLQPDMDYELATVSKFAEVAKQFGITPCLHPHHNTYVMFEREIDYILQNTDPKDIMFAPDTAHIVAADADPVSVISKYADRVGYIHLKDFAAGADVGSMGFSREDVEVYRNFSELGKGSVDFPAVLKILKDANFDGYYCIELDRAPSSNAESCRNNLNYLKSIFI